MRALILLLALPLAACATTANGDYPSLAPRPIEQRSDAEPETVPAVAAPDPQLDTNLATLGADLTEAATAFDTAARRIEGRLAAARSGGVGSEAWIEAQTALSEVDTARARTATALAELERLAIDRAAQGQPPYPALEAALTRTREQTAAQNARYETLSGSLPTP